MRALLLTLVLLLPLGCGSTPPPPTGGTAPRVMKREDFKTAVIGKTKAEVLEILGRPMKTSERNPGESWMYRGRSFDPVASKEDDFQHVRFDAEGKCVEVTF